MIQTAFYINSMEEPLPDNLNEDKFISAVTLKRFLIGKLFDLQASYDAWVVWFKWYITYKPYKIKDNDPMVLRFREKDIGSIHGVDRNYHPLVVLKSANCLP